jgi:hypothetical protein
MLSLLYKFFIGNFHLHKWKIIYEQVLERARSGVEVGTFYTMQCEKCGEIKTKKTCL